MRKYADLLFQLVSMLTLVVALAALVTLVYDILSDGAARLNWAFLNNIGSRFADQAGVYHALMGSIWVIGLTAALALPVGVAAAIYLEEYGTRSRIARFIELNIANLAAVPSIIYGLLGLGLFVRTMGFGRSVLAGAATLALLVLPIVILATREALRTVPPSIREASYALGATKSRTIVTVVLPAALPGIVSGCLLAIARAAGETAPLLFAVGASTAFNTSLFDGANTALSIQIFGNATSSFAAAQERAWGAAFTLVFVTFLVTFAARVMTARFALKR